MKYNIEDLVVGERVLIDTTHYASIGIVYTVHFMHKYSNDFNARLEGTPNKGIRRVRTKSTKIARLKYFDKDLKSLNKI